MPKHKSKSVLNLNLLKPQSNPEKLLSKLIHWLLSSGRYIFVLVEAVVLIAFGARFKLDADLQAKKEAIEEQIPYIESLKPYEIIIRETQFKLSTIDSVRKDSIDWPLVLKKIADQTPFGIKIISINIEKKVDLALIHITGQTQVTNDLASFITGLKGDSTFSNISLTSVGLEQNIVKFTIDTQVTNPGGKSS
ncbi:PilN domain-containing protein [Candidatus Daviesbacteria bacterium]|nr:PilN domain-containing protein [Candidatus Daviesbacteria bacterium]